MDRDCRPCSAAAVRVEFGAAADPFSGAKDPFVFTEGLGSQGDWVFGPRGFWFTEGSGSQRVLVPIGIRLPDDLSLGSQGVVVLKEFGFPEGLGS